MSELSELAKGGHVWGVGDYKHKAPLPLAARLFIQFAIIVPALLGAIKLYLYLTVDFNKTKYTFHVTKSTFSYTAPDGFGVSTLSALLGLAGCLVVVTAMATISAYRRRWVILGHTFTVFVVVMVFFSIINHIVNSENPVVTQKVSSWIHERTGPLTTKGEQTTRNTMILDSNSSFYLTGKNGTKWILLTGESTNFTLKELAR